jgi:hypothetical protein
MFSLRRCGAGKQREEVLDETDTTWQQSVHYFRWAIQDKSIDLKFVFDIDEMCLFFCGHIGWAKHPKSIQKQRVENDHKQDKNYRKTCSLTLVGTAMGRVLKPVVVGKEDEDFGIDEDSGRKLRQLWAYEVPGLGKLGDLLIIHSNHNGFFDTETYCQNVMHESIEPFAQELPIDQWALGLHDAAPTHNGFIKAKGNHEEQHFHFGTEGKPMSLKDWLRCRRVIEGRVPPGFTKFRPNDQRMFNFIFRWQYDVALASLTNKADFRNPGVNADVDIVLTAVAIAVH